MGIFTERYIRPLFCEGVGPFRWLAISGDPQDIYTVDDIILEHFAGEPITHWITAARAAVQFTGSARAHRLARLRRPPQARPARQRGRRERPHLRPDRVHARPPRLGLRRGARARDRAHARRLRRHRRLADPERTPQHRLARRPRGRPRLRRPGPVGRRHDDRRRLRAGRRASSAPCSRTTRESASCVMPTPATRPPSPLLLATDWGSDMAIARDDALGLDEVAEALDNGWTLPGPLVLRSRRGRSSSTSGSSRAAGRCSARRPSSPRRATTSSACPAACPSSSRATTTAGCTASSTSAATAPIPVAMKDGCRKLLQCRYHGWTYTLDGRLQNAPRMSREMDFDRDELSLIPVSVDTWRGFVFVNPDAAAASPDSTSTRRSSRSRSSATSASPTGSSASTGSIRSRPTGRSSSRTRSSATTARRCTRRASATRSSRTRTSTSSSRPAACCASSRPTTRAARTRAGAARRATASASSTSGRRRSGPRTTRSRSPA